MIHSKHSSSSFCVLPFIQQFVNTDNRIAPCCISDYSHGGPEYKDANSFNCDYLKNIRREMLYSKQPKPCSICYKDEAKGKSSKRIEVNKQFEDWEYITNGQGYMYTMPQYYDLRPGNVCNLKCIMCNPQNSSKWIEDNHLLEENGQIKLYLTMKIVMIKLLNLAMKQLTTYYLILNQLSVYN